MSLDDAAIAAAFFSSALGFGFAVGAWFYFVAWFCLGGGRLVRDWFGF